MSEQLGKRLRWFHETLQLDHCHGVRRLCGGTAMNKTVTYPKIATPVATAMPKEAPLAASLTNLAVSELAANAVLHGATTFALSIERTNAFVRAEVVDDGGGQVRVLSPSHEDSQGRGLQIVELLSDQWGTTEQGVAGKVVWFVRSLPTPTMAEPALEACPLILPAGPAP